MTFDPKHLRPTQIVRGEQVDWIAWLRRDDRPGQAEHGKCIAYFKTLEAAYATEREMHNAWRKLAEEAEARVQQLESEKRTLSGALRQIRDWATIEAPSWIHFIDDALAYTRRST